MVRDDEQAEEEGKFDRCTLHQLRFARENLTQCLGELSQIRARLDKSARKLQTIDNELPSLGLRLRPVCEKISLIDDLSVEVNDAVSRSCKVLEVGKSIRVLQNRLLFEDPKVDLRRYLSMLCTLERYIETAEQLYVPALDKLERALTVLGTSGTLDKYKLVCLARELTCTRNVPNIFDRCSGALLKLENEFYRLLAGHGPLADMDDILMQHGEDVETSPSTLTRPLNQNVLHKLLVIAQRLKANGRVEACLRMYKEARVVVLRETMSRIGVTHTLLSSARKVDMVEWEEVHDQIFSWVGQLKAVVKVLMVNEREACVQLFSTVGIEGWEACFVEILEGSNLCALFEFAEAVACSHQRPEALLLGLLDIFRAIQDVLIEGRLVFDMCPPHSGFLSALHSLQKVVVRNLTRAFWELAHGVSECSASLPVHGGKDFNASFVVNYMGMIARDYMELMNAALNLMHQSSKSDPANLLVDFPGASRSIMMILEKNLEERSKQYADPALGHLFLMNNLCHVLARLKQCKQLVESLGEEWMSEWKNRSDMHLKFFLRKGWENVVMYINKDTLHASGGRAVVFSDVLKSNLQAFNQAFQDAYDKQTHWIILDPQIRDFTRLYIVQMVVPAYQDFINAYRPFVVEEGTAYQKLMKYSPQLLKTMIGELFEVKSLSTSHTEDDHSF